MLEVILDTETTGLSTIEKHKIVEIGCIELDNQISTNKIFHHLIDPKRSISEEAQKIHGYTEKFLTGKKFDKFFSTFFVVFIYFAIVCIYTIFIRGKTFAFFSFF